jgi:hypothetical protein
MGRKNALYLLQFYSSRPFPELGFDPEIVPWTLEMLIFPTFLFSLTFDDSVLP